METLFEAIRYYFLNFIYRYSFFTSSAYYDDLFSKFFSFKGFIAGFVFVALVYLLCYEKQNKTGFIKVLSAIAVINSCSTISIFLYRTFSQKFMYDRFDLVLVGPDNIISGFILTLVIFSCYRKLGGRAFLFGVTTHAVIPLLNFSYLSYYGVTISSIIFQLALTGLICLIMCYRKHFFTCWIWYFVFREGIRFAAYISIYLSDFTDIGLSYTGEFLRSAAIEYLPRFIIDAVIFAVVLIFALIFEKGVLTLRSAGKTI